MMQNYIQKAYPNMVMIAIILAKSQFIVFSSDLLGIRS